MKLLELFSVFVSLCRVDSVNFHPEVIVFVKEYAQRQGFQHVHFIHPLEESGGTSRSFKQTLWSKWLLTASRSSPAFYTAFHNSCQTKWNSSITKNHSWECDQIPFAFLRKRSVSSPLFVGWLFTDEDLRSLQNIFDSKEHRRSSWLIISSHKMILFVSELDLPLDNKAVFAIVNDNKNSKSIEVDLWDIYKAASHLTPKKYLLGRWSAKKWRPSTGVLRERTHQGSLPSPESNDREELIEIQGGLVKGQFQPLPLPPLFSREPWERRRDLSGLVLRCTTNQDYPLMMFSDVNEDDTVRAESFHGVIGSVFYMLRQTLNFTPHCFVTGDRTWGSLREGKWTGMIGDLVEDRADIAVGNIDHNFARSQAVDFTHRLRTEGNRLWIKYVPTFENARNSYTREFTWAAWLSAVLFGIMMCLCLHFVFRHSPYQEEKPLSEVIWLTVAAFCNAGETVSTVSASSRFLLLTLYLTTMILHAYYSSFLISSLTVDMNNLPFTDLRTMYEARTHSFGFIGGTGVEDEFKLSPVSLHRRIWDEMVLADPRNLSPSMDDLIKRLCTEQHATMTTLSFIRSSYLPCKLLFLPDSYFVSQKSMPLQKGSPLLGIFRFQMRKIVESGITDRLEKKWVPKLADSPDVDRSPISLLQASTAFYFLLLGHLAAFLVLVIEIKFANGRR